MREVMVRSRRWLYLGAAGTLLLAAFIASQFFCVGAFVKRGVVIPACPDGELRQALFVDCQGLRRGVEGTVRLGVFAHYTMGDADADAVTAVRRFDANLALVRDKGQETPLALARGWQKQGDLRTGAIALPKDLPDGDYLIRARVHSSIADSTLDVPLAVYAPARIHVITDRPLYEPGNTVQFRAVVVRATDFAPLDARPGRWLVQDPSGETVLEEKAPAGAYGVVAGSFPLDAGAPNGSWRVRWVSGGAEDGVSFTVEPFTLPRFRVEASAARPFYRAGDRPTVHGKIVYSSGAPVRGASIEITWTVDGAWPPPTDWQEGGLPKHAVSDAGGAFDLKLPLVPRDLRGRVTLAARLAATDPAGDRVEGATSVLLTEHAIQIAPVTELADGLVAGFNNRLYLRATSAAGEVLANTELRVKRAWEPADPGIAATTDEDGVAALQIDPGPPVNVLIPPMPVRPQPRPPAITRDETLELVSGEAPPLADNVGLDRWTAMLGACTRFATGTAEKTKVAARVNAAGAVVATAGDGAPLGDCLAAALRGKRLPAGHERLYQLEYSVTSDLPDLTLQLNSAPGTLNGLEAALKTEALDARSCLPRNLASSSLPRMLFFTANPARKALSFSWVPDRQPEEKRAPAAVAACIERKLRPPPWSALAKTGGSDEDGDDEATGEVLGMARFSIEGVGHEEQERAEATIRLGYDLTISARRDGKEVGSTPLVLSPGHVPPIRLRASPVMAQAGGEVEVAILRGPGFSAELPKTLVMTHPHGSIEAPVDETTRAARFKLPADARGWFEVAWAGGRALVYVRPPEELAVTIKAGADRYAPGAMAQLAIRTTAGKRGTPAAVGLIGVDASLAQLVSLPGPDDMARLRPHAKTDKPAFDVLDVGALEMGRLRGTNAATATVLRVTALPEATALDATIDASAQPPFDPIAPLTDGFYNALGELHAQVRQWEEHAGHQQMHPPVMAKLWNAALDACEKRHEAVSDAYGRRLRLHRLPPDLLALTDPRVVVIDGTHLPEDVENWTAWVAKEKP
jgi:hypothetical protein